MAGRIDRPAQRRCSEIGRPSRPEAARNELQPAFDTSVLFRRFAELLDLGELEDAIVAELRRGLPQVSAFVRLGPEASQSFAAPAKADGRRRPVNPAEPILAAVVEWRGRQIGFVGYVHDAALASCLGAAKERLEIVAREAALPAANALRHAEALNLAYRDPLTSLYNRRALMDYLEREAQRSNRHGRALALVMLDLDGLKEINDRFGHQTGDEAIQRLGRVLERTVRRADLAARLGGDEFAVLCPDTTAESARRVGVRVQKALAADDLHGMRLGVTFGAADLLQADGQPNRLVELADMDLYAGKRLRGRCRMAPATPREQEIPAH